jgi:type I restriction enzyme, S subunit
MSELVLEKNNMLPEKWIEISLDRISDIVLGQSPPSSTYNKEGDGLPFFQGKAEFGSLYPIPKIWCNKPKKLAERNDVLLSVRAPVGTTNLCPEKSCIGRGLAAIRPKGGIPVRFVLYFLRYIEHDLERQGTGTTFKAISGNQIKSIIIPIPPLNEQKRIVTKIEELFSLVQEDVSLLKKIKKQLILYRKSLLFSAFNGTLTNFWREKSNLSGKITVENSLKQRYDLWKEKENSKKKHTKYIPPTKPFLSNLPKIPNSWVWASFEEISERVTVGHVGSMRNEYLDSGIPFLRSQNVRENRFDEKGLKFISKEFHKKISKSKLSPNDIVVVRSGAVGVSCVIPETLNDANCSDLLIVKNPLGINPHFGAFYLNSITESKVRQQQVGITLTHFNTKSLAKLAIPVPHMDEQIILVMMTQKSYSFIDNIMKILENSEQKLSLFKHSVLKQAFEGKLVPQDPNDEPAEILLQKIKQEKQKIIKETKPRKKKNDK